MLDPIQKILLLLGVVCGFICLVMILLKIWRFNKKKCIYSEVEVQPGISPHNDTIAAISIYEDTSAARSKNIGHKTDDELWNIVNVQKVGSNIADDGVGAMTKLIVSTGNGRRWVYELFWENRWEWLIEMPIIRFLNDDSFRQTIESNVCAGKGDADNELLVACCLLHATGYHLHFKKYGVNKWQTEKECAEYLLLSSSKKGNVNAMYELACFYYANKEYDKACVINEAIKEIRGEGVWFIERRW